MVDPYVPKHPQGTASELPTESGAVDVVRAAGVMFRLVAMSVVLMLLLFGAYYAIEVFRQVGSLIKEPAQAKAAVDAIAEMAEAQNLKVPVEGDNVSIGRVVAILILGLGYLLWAWIPLVIVSMTGRLLLAMTQSRKPDTSTAETER